MFMVKAIFFFFFLFSFHLSLAQYDETKIDKKAVALYNQALIAGEAGAYAEALKSLQDAIARAPGYLNAYLSMAGVYAQMKNYGQSVAWYEKAFAIDSNYTSGYRLPYAINLAGLGRFSEALQTINILLSRPDINSNTRKAAEYRKRTFQLAVDFAAAHKAETYVFDPKNLGDGINTAESEYFPSLPITGAEMVFTRRVKDRNEDFFGSSKTDTGWAKAFSLGGGVNTPDNEGAQNISQDGAWLLFTGCNRPDGFGSCDLYISYLTKDGWSEASNMGAQLNSREWDSQPCLSPDKKDLYFASRRPGGYGGSDIYVSHWGSNGRWSNPENLGPQINTSGDESGPFIHADNQTLYFASNGLPGYGMEDLFVVRKGGDGVWGTPRNLGYPINTINSEGSVFITADGHTAYYASDKSDSKGGLDIYSFEMRPDSRPAATIWVKGKVFDKKTAAGLPSGVELIDLATGRTVSKVQTDEGGHYLITLPLGKDYAFAVSRRGYLFYSDNYSLKNGSPNNTYEKNIPLQPLEATASVVLNNIFFDVKQYEVKPESGAELDKVVQLLKDNPTLKIQIAGYTDNVGTPADNVLLSTNRAKAVVAYLTAKGIPAGRLSYKGYGEAAPVGDNKTEEGRARNRRTELKVVSI